MGYSIRSSSFLFTWYRYSCDFSYLYTILLSTLLSDGIHWSDIARSITFGLFTAPFVIYFFTLLVERLERSRLELSKTLARLEKNSRDKSTLLATISHELRTPLNGIIGLSRILLDDKLTEQQQKLS